MPPSDPPSYAEARSTWDPSRNMNPLDASAPVPELPLYSPTRRSRSTSSRPILRQETEEFKYEMMKGNKAVVELIVIALRSHSKSVPTFMQGSPMKGIIRLNLEKPDYIQSVDISIFGQYITGAEPGDQNLKFLEVSHNLWSPSDGHPRNTLDINGSHLPPSTSRASSGAKFSGKLQGEYTWPFSLDMPSEVSVPSGSRGEIKMFSPPQTFNERHTYGSIVYEMRVKVTRSKWKTHYRVPAPFWYMPCIRPPPLPPLRQLAYHDQDCVSLVGPTVDLESWYRCGPVKVEGKLFNDHPSDVACSLYLAKPLSYTRGSLIPFCLQLESDDQQALDLLSPPKSIIVRLKRLIQYHFDPGRAPGLSIDYSDRAVLWPSLEGLEDPSKRLRFVNGELYIKSDIRPSSAVGDFRIQYSVVLFPFDAVGFDPVDSHPLIEQPVEMTTRYGLGPRPKSFAPR